MYFKYEKDGCSNAHYHWRKEGLRLKTKKKEKRKKGKWKDSMVFYLEDHKQIWDPFCDV